MSVLSLAKFFDRSKKISIEPTNVAQKKGFDRLMLGVGVTTLAAVSLSLAGAYVATQKGDDLFQQGMADNLKQELVERGLSEYLADEQPVGVHVLNRKSMEGISLALSLNKQVKDRFDPIDQVDEAVRFRYGGNASYYTMSKSEVNFIKPPQEHDEVTNLHSLLGEQVPADQIDTSQHPITDLESSNLIFLHELGHGLNSRESHSLGKAKISMRRELNADIYMVEKARELNLSEAGLQRMAMARSLSNFTVEKPGLFSLPSVGYNGTHFNWTSNHATSGAIWAEIRGQEQLEGIGSSRFTHVQYQAQYELAKLVDERVEAQGGWQSDTHKIAQAADHMAALYADGSLEQITYRDQSLAPVIKQNIEDYVRSVKVLLPKIGAQMQQETPVSWSNFVGQEQANGPINSDKLAASEVPHKKIIDQIMKQQQKKKAAAAPNAQS